MKPAKARAALVKWTPSVVSQAGPRHSPSRIAVRPCSGRLIDAHDVLGPALQGFSPTPEFPQIAEAMRFVAANKAAGEQS